MFRRILYVAAVIAATACGGESDSVGPIDPPPPPPTLSVQIMGDASSITNDGKLPVSASITPTTPPSDKIAWKLNGQAAGQGVSITVTLNPGDNQVCVDVTGAKGEVCKTYSYTPPTPKLICKVVVANPTNESLTEALQITVSKGSQSATRTVGLDGDCSLETPFKLASAADTARVVLTGTSGAPQTVHPMIAYVSQADAAKGIVLVAVPRSYQITDGAYKDTVVPIDLNLAYKEGADGKSFYPRISEEAGFGYQVIGLSATALPFQPIVLDKPEQVTPASLTALTTGIDSLNKLLGQTIALPPVKRSTAPSSSFGYWVISQDSTMAPPSTGDFISSGEGGQAGHGGTNSEVMSGSIVFYKDASFNITAILHEIGHVLAPKHGCGWLSVMNQACDWSDSVFKSTGGNRSSTMTAHDVAYIKLMWRVAALQKKYGTLFSLGESHQGERVLTLKPAQPEQKVSHIY